MLYVQIEIDERTLAVKKTEVLPDKPPENPTNWLDLLPRKRKLRDFISAIVIHVLNRNHGNRTYTADELGISIRNLRMRLEEYREEGWNVPKSSRYVEKKIIYDQIKES